MIHEMTKLELEVRSSSSPSFSYLPTSNKTTTFDCPCIPVYQSDHLRREQTKSTAGRKETKCYNDLLHPKLLCSKKKKSQRRKRYISLPYYLCHIIILNQVGTHLLLTYSLHIYDTGTLCLCYPFMNKQYATPTPISTYAMNFPIILVN